MAGRSEAPPESNREQGSDLEREMNVDSEEMQRRVVFEPNGDQVGTVDTAPCDENQQSDQDEEDDDQSGDDDPRPDEADDDQQSSEDDPQSDKDDLQSDKDDQQVDNYLGFDDNVVTVSDTEMNDEPRVNTSGVTSRVDQPEETPIRYSVGAPISFKYPITADIPA